MVLLSCNDKTIKSAMVRNGDFSLMVSVINVLKTYCWSISVHDHFYLCNYVSTVLNVVFGRCEQRFIDTERKGTFL